MNNNALNFLDSKEQATVEQAIAEAENQTSAEIVCAVATESGRYDRAESIIGLCAGLLALWAANVGHLMWLESSPEGLSNGSGLALIWQVLAVAVGFLAGILVASHCHPLRRLCVLPKEMQAEADRAASHLFGMRRLASTRDSGGLLLYVSLFERRAVVLADFGILDALGEDFTTELKDSCIDQLKAGRSVEAFTVPVKASVDRLAKALPVVDDNPNELPNALVRVHPRP